jgi:hypothetical protein
MRRFKVILSTGNYIPPAVGEAARAMVLAHVKREA